MTFIRLGHLRSVRRIVKRLLTDRADVYTLKPVGSDPVTQRPKGRQRWPDDYTTRLASQPIRVSASPWRTQETVQGAQVRARGEWTLTFESATAVSAEDTVKLTATTRTVGLRGRVFNVVGLLNGSDEVVRRAEADEIV